MMAINETATMAEAATDQLKVLLSIRADYWM
jgi:hypothetical protein